DGASVIAEEIAIETAGGVIVRHAAAAPFFVDAGTERVLVRGPVRLIAEPPWTVGGRKIRHDDALPYELGLPRDLRVKGVARRTRLVETPQQVLVIGASSFEALPEHAALRDAGTTRVLVGEAGAPVLVACPHVTAPLA